MDDSQLRNEVLELTLACLQGDATAEERARLERLLSDSPQAITWYLRMVDDTLTLRDAAAARETTSSSPASAARLTSSEPVSPARRRPSLSSFTGGRWSRSWLGLAAISCLLLISAAMPFLWWLNHTRPNSERIAEGNSARIVDVSNVAWTAGARQYDEWSFVRPGDTLKFESGWINLFMANGAELLIEGPADVQFVSVQNVFARQGKLAARVSPGAHRLSD